MSFQQDCARFGDELARLVDGGTSVKDAAILVDQGLVPSEKIRPRGKSEAKRRFDELVVQGWSTARAAREVGVHPRTGRD
ncbi:MAG: hypothetical protein L0H31_12730 [Nocardioidaceae bacterium]|uniref:IS30 family transposase n=1 Tax=Dietzia maris TaxID=37915 RepID=A0ABT8H5U7_9ACTN|nr:MULTISPECIES: hypothetical protein [Dietzia]MCY1655660.1 hypothetical protein [Dietzia sp. SL131]MDN4507845.1 hypothetical protein [Dietzia maris]MDN5745974.1 hypothetical protein [Nocardioidaceae bacterium]